MSGRGVLAAAAVAASAACGTFDPQPDPTRFYLMSAIPATPQGSDAMDGLVVGLGPSWIAPYLNQQKIVTRVEPNQVDFAEYERWAEPFDAHLVRIVGQEIQNLTGAEAVVRYPWVGRETVDVSVELRVYRFDRLPGGEAEAEVSWLIRGGGSPTSPVLARDNAILQEPATGSGSGGSVRTEDSVDAMSRLVSRLADTIADALVRSRPRLGAGSGF